MTTWLRATALEGDPASGVRVGEVPPDWAQGRSAFGGLIAALGMRALDAIVPRDRAVRSMLVDFVAPVAPGPVRVETLVLRSGRALTHARAHVMQNGEVCAVVLATFGSSRPSKVHLAPPPPPAAPLPNELVRLPYIEGVTPTFTQQFDFRWASDRLPFTGASRANLGGWIRHAEPLPCDAASLVGLVDAWPAPVLPLLSAPAPASSVTWMLDFVAPIPSNTEWWRFECDALAAESGYASIDGKMWDDSGTLVATSRQLVVEFS